jgi:SAM-dependent methyltransferase
MKLSGNSSHSRYQWAEAQLAAALHPVTGKMVADIGTGDSRMRNVVETLGAQWRGYDLDPLVEGVTRWDIEQAADSTFPKANVILMLDVVEHLGNPWQALRNVSSLLLPGGHLIMTTPNPLWSRSRMWALATGNAICFTQSDLDLNHHVFTPWPHIVERLLADSDLVVHRYDTLDGRTEWPSAPYNIRYPIRLGLACIHKWIERRDPAACGMSYGMVARKAG